MKKFKIRSADFYILKTMAYFFVGLFAIITFLPFVAMVVSSFTTEKDIITYGYTLFPKHFSIDAYKLIFMYPKHILDAYKITLFVTIGGTMTSLFFSTMAAYVMFRKEVKYRTQMAFFLYFTELFNGGLASYFIVVSNMLHLKNSIWVLVLVPLFSVFNILILRNFINGSIPYSLVESAKIDGANDFTTYLKIVLPLSKPAMASVGLFIALVYWNDWWTPMMFVEKKALFPLQYTLYQILSSVNVAANMVGNVSSMVMPKESLKLAMTVVSTGPIILLYPFAQKYFVKGITVGAVKG